MLEFSKFSDETLVEAVIIYTHQLHGSPEPQRADIREKRNMVKSELLRRLADKRA